MKGSPSTRSMAQVNRSSKKSQDLRLLLHSHRLLLLLQLLDHQDQCLDLLCQDSEQVLLGHRRQRWWSEGLHLLTASFVMMRRISDVADKGVLHLHDHHCALNSGNLMFAYCPVPDMPICCHQTALYRTSTVADGALVFSGWNRELLLVALGQKHTRTVPRSGFQEDPMMFKSMDRRNRP